MKNLTIIASFIIFSPQIVLAACPYSTTLNSTTNTCEKSGCSGNCTIIYSTIPNQENRYDAVVKPNPGVQGEVVLKEYDVSPGLKVRDLTVGEGITKLGGLSIWSNGSGTLKLPSTLTSMEGNMATYSIGFETIDVSDVKNLQSSGGAYGNSAENTIGLSGASRLKNLIVSEDTSPIALGYAYDMEYPATGLVIQCKGTDTNKCKNLLSYNKKGWYYVPSGFKTTSEYYIQKDEQGNILEEWGPNGCTKYSYDAAGNLQRKIDENGHILWARRIYNVDEATKATSKGSKNTFSIKYR